MIIFIAGLIPAAAGGAGRPVLHRPDDAPPRPTAQFRNEHNSCTYLLHTGTTEMPPGDTNASIAAAAAGPVRVAVDRLADRVRRAARTRASGLPGRRRAAARKPDELPRPRPRPARAAVRPLGRRSGPAVPRARPGRLVPQLLQPRRPQRPRAAPPARARRRGGTTPVAATPTSTCPTWPATPVAARPLGEPRVAAGPARRAAPASTPRTARGARRLGRPPPPGHAAAAGDAGPGGRTRST